MNLGTYAPVYDGHLHLRREESTAQRFSPEDFERMSEYYILLCSKHRVWVGADSLPIALNLLAGSLEVSAAGCTSAEVHVVKLLSNSGFSDYPRVFAGNQLHLKPDWFVDQIGPISFSLL
jgi:hypothetical protein